MDWLAQSGNALQGTLVMPGDKSISHRALLLASVAEGITDIRGLLHSLDVQATMQIMQSLGVRVDSVDAQTIRVYGVGLYGLQPSFQFLDCGNSGTSMRLLAGLLAGQKFPSVLRGDDSLQRRPMSRVVVPLSMMHANIKATKAEFPPLHILPVDRLQAISYVPPVASAQVKSSILLAGLYAFGTTKILEKTPTRDHTERLLIAFSYPIKSEGGWLHLAGQAALQATYINIPGDFSSAAFFIVAATIIPDSQIVIQNVGVNSRRIGLLYALKKMGAQIQMVNFRVQNGESVADIMVQSAALTGISLNQSWVADMIDEFPIFFVAAACAQGTTEIRGLQELRVKESDRIRVMVEALQKMGVAVNEFEAGVEITGGELLGGAVDSAGDHRVVMAMVVAAQVAKRPVLIKNCTPVSTSFPDFMNMASQCGMQLSMYVE